MTEPTKRPRAPTITVDTSAINDQSQREQEPGSAYLSPGTSGNPNSLSVPAARARGDSVDSQSSGGSHTIVGSPLHGSEHAAFNVGSETEVWKPEDEDESKAFQEENSPFGITKGHLGKFIPRKDLRAFYHIRGLGGLETGLRTNLKNGLPADEQSLNGNVSWEKVKGANATEIDVPGSNLPRTNTQKSLASESKNAYADRKRIFGDNRLPERKPKNIFQLAWEALQDKVLIVLSVAAVVSLALGIYQSVRPKKPGDPAKIEWIEGVAIIIAIVVVVLVGALNDWSKERQFAKLNKKKENREVKVIRSGKTINVSVYDIFVGDVMILEQGDVLPVDGIYIDGHNVSCDESSATGESDLMKKTPGTTVWRAMDTGADMKKMDPFILSGARVSEGFGTFLVTAVGVHSSHGKTMLSLREDTEATPLQYKLNRLASYIAKLGSSAGLLLFVVLFIEFLARLGKPNPDGSSRTPDEKAQGFIDILIVAVTIVVVAVPEGLPLAVTLALAFATKRMTKDNNLVRHLQSCETMGNATVICSDKTGTLTQNVMTVVAGTFGRGSIHVGDKDRVPSKDERTYTDGTTGSAATESSTETVTDTETLPIYKLHEKMTRENQLLLKDSIALNSTAFEGEEDGKKAFVGSKTETALLDLAARCFGLTNLAKEREDADITQLFPFDSRKKSMAVVVKQADKKYRVFVKGASEIVLSKCTQVLDQPLQSTHVADLAESDRSTITSIISNYAQMSLRTIGLAYRDVESWPPPDMRRNADNPDLVEFDDLFNDLTWISVVGIQDPVRKGVPEAVKTCEKAGVKVVMVTGDNVETARAIAKECGILKEDGIVIEGPKFRQLSQVEVEDMLPKLCVVARSSPEDKKTLVKAFRSEGHVVAVTGDGTNDAPALKAADVGFSMGITGTEVAKEASDIILMDDNFSSIVKALAWGRTINDAVKKFLQFQITVNIVAVLLTFVTAVSSDEEASVLNAVQLLWVNLIMDTFAALALATDPPAGSLFDRKPEPRSSPLISATMWKQIIGQTIFQLIVTFTLYWAGPSFIAHDDDRQFATLIFNVFVWMQIFDALNSRRIDNQKNIFEGFYRNYWFMLIILIMIGGQVLIVFVGGDAFVVSPLRASHWGISIVIGFLTLPIGFLLRCIPDRFIRIDKPLKRAVRAVVPQSIQQRYRDRKIKRAMAATPASHDGTGNNDKAANKEQFFSREWFRVAQQVNNDLSLYKSLRGRRLAIIKEGIRHPRETFSRSRSGSRHSVLPALIAPGAMAGGIGGSVSPSDGRSVNSRSLNGEGGTPPRQLTPPRGGKAELGRDDMVGGLEGSSGSYHRH